MEEKHRRSFELWTATALILLPLFYFLSMGPVLWLSNRYHLPDWVLFPYVPVVVLGMNVAWANRVIQWYLSFWR